NNMNIQDLLKEQERIIIKETQAERKRMCEDPEFYKTGFFGTMYRVRLIQEAHEKATNSRLKFGYDLH
ncbi:hypothetical protein J4474_02640, partial [Candidatus Pacearchaeota archaeon]|nr:hypothetical protein [Candidatus Pacearchaeota archaeon]